MCNSQSPSSQSPGTIRGARIWFAVYRMSGTAGPGHHFTFVKTSGFIIAWPSAGIRRSLAAGSSQEQRY
jgi:hypothetical protein